MSQPKDNLDNMKVAEDTRDTEDLKPEIIVEAHIIESTQVIDFGPDYVLVDGVRHPYSYLFALASIDNGLL